MTLLDCDVKLIMLIMSNRLQRPLDYLVDIVQSAFLRGRDISDNVRYHLGLRGRLHELVLPAWLLHSDLIKAYDSVNRPMLLRTMQHMGLWNTGIVHWTRVLQKGTSARVRVNGFLSPPLAVREVSLPQGGALSCQLWLTVALLFTFYLSSKQHSRELSSFPLTSGAPAPAAMVIADDITAPILDLSQLKGVVRPAFQAGFPPFLRLPPMYTLDKRSATWSGQLTALHRFHSFSPSTPPPTHFLKSQHCTHALNLLGAVQSSRKSLQCITEALENSFAPCLKKMNVERRTRGRQEQRRCMVDCVVPRLPSLLYALKSPPKWWSCPPSICSQQHRLHSGYTQVFLPPLQRPRLCWNNHR
jgi:hypothetical protein